MMNTMSKFNASEIVRLTLKTCSFTIRLIFVFIATFRDLVADANSQTKSDKTLDSSIRGGALNYRTGKLDDGTDPYGWYEND